MPIVDVMDKTGQKVTQIELPDDVYGARVREHLLWEVVRAQRAAKRAGSACTKERWEVRGGGKKPYRQKGTGRARQGSSRSPNHVGGGTVFGPKPRSYELKVGKKVRRAALRSALSLRLKEKKLLVLSDLELSEIKTKALAGILKGLELDSALIVESKSNREAVLSARNLASHKLLPPEGLNVYDILLHKTLVMTQKVAMEVGERLMPGTVSRGARRKS